MPDTPAMTVREATLAYPMPSNSYFFPGQSVVAPNFSSRTQCWTIDGNLDDYCVHLPLEHTVPEFRFDGPDRSNDTRQNGSQRKMNENLAIVPTKIGQTLWYVGSDVLKAGTLICYYHGTAPTLEKIKETEQLKNDTYFVAGKNQAEKTDARNFGSIGRFLSHSCSPNVEMPVRTGASNIKMVTVTDIYPHTELTIDYSWLHNNPGIPMDEYNQCACQSIICRRYIEQYNTGPAQ